MRLFTSAILGAFMVCSPVQADNGFMFDFSYKNKGAYQIQKVRMQFIDVDGNILATQNSTDSVETWNVHMADWPREIKNAMRKSSNPLALRAKFTFWIRAGEKENCSQTFDVRQKVVWDTFSKGTTQLKNRCRTTNYTGTDAPYQPLTPISDSGT